MGAFFVAGTAQAYPPSLIPSSGAYFGAYINPRGGETAEQAVQRGEAQVGRKFSIDHQYYRWDQAIPTAHERWDVRTGRIPFANWKAQTASGSVVRWSAIANGSQDAWISQRAEAFRAFGSPIYLSFHHEPENDLTTFGTPADYAAAFRHIVDVFRAEGATNVGFVWTMMSWTFVPASGRDPNAYYPGDGYVDFVGSDGYDWYPGRPTTNWQSFQEIFQQTNDFAVAHNKPWIAVEYGVQEDPAVPGRKGQWFRDISATAPLWPLLKGLVYFDAWTDFPWIFDSSTSSKEGLAALGGDPYFNPGSTAPPPVVGPTLLNSLDLGPDDALIQAGSLASLGDPFNLVVISAGATLTYDNTHALGAFAAKHALSAGSDAYYEWDGTRTIWFGRIYLRLVARPTSNLRLIRAASSGHLDCSIDVMPSGTLQFNDAANQPIVATRARVSTGRWIRIEWKVNHTRGTVVLKLFKRADSTRPNDVVRGGPSLAIGTSANQFQFGRSGHQPFEIRFWTDDPGLSSVGYLGPRRPTRA